MKTRWFSHSAAAILLAGISCFLPATTEQAQIISFGGLGSTAPTTSFQGQAAAVAGLAAGSAVSVADTGPLPASGGAQEASALETSVAAGISVGASHSAVIGGANNSSAEASVANVSLTSGGPFGQTIITAGFVMARGVVVCGTFGAGISAQSEVSALVVNGQTVAVTGMANQLVFLSGGYLIINEQIAGFGTITVNALHVFDVIAGVNVVFGSATAGITCPGPTNPPGPPPNGSQPCGFVTGGGWITGTPSGAKGNFGVAGGIKNGAFWGHLNYIDHGNGMHVKATAVTGYADDPTDPDCRIIDYNVTIDGQAGTARVHVCDKGEPGRNDIFQIQLSSGYFAGGDLGGSRPGGGNIQLHKCQ